MNYIIFIIFIILFFMIISNTYIQNTNSENEIPKEIKFYRPKKFILQTIIKDFLKIIILFYVINPQNVIYMFQLLIQIYRQNYQN